METNNKKLGLVILKENIKNLVEEQKFFKNQRKTVNLVGDRKVEPWEAIYKHQQNREKLRIMYAAYGLARGKKYSEIENHYLEENHPLTQFQRQIDKVLEEYELKEEVCE